MSEIIINGGYTLYGDVKLQGSKNSVLPILAATVLCSGVCQINNCPCITDVETTIEILKHLGCVVKFKNSVLIVNASKINRSDIPEHLMRKMRSSIIFLGALISRFSKAEVSIPGGCELGPRPIDLHLEGLKQMGVVIEEKNSNFRCTISEKNRNSNNKIILKFPSVGATQNLMLVAAGMNGTTILKNVAQEPEILHLANFLIKTGVNITGAGTSNEIQIKGVKNFREVDFFIPPDRIAAITYLCCAAVTGGKIFINSNLENNIDSVINILEESGCFIKKYADRIQIISPMRLNSVKDIRTMPYPGFPTDAQALMMALLAKASGTSVIIETIFQNRFKHVQELNRFGAKIKVEGNIAIIDGVERLNGAKTEATDLRGGAALVICALGAEGKSKIYEIKHLKRGYENIVKILNKLGAKITCN